MWLRTDAAGLYGVAVADLAAGLGKNPRNIRRKAKRGRLSLTDDDQPVPWYFDNAADRILFVAEAYDTFYTGENAYRFSLGKKMAQRMDVATGRHSAGVWSSSSDRGVLTLPRFAGVT